MASRDSRPPTPQAQLPTLTSAHRSGLSADEVAVTLVGLIPRPLPLDLPEVDAAGSLSKAEADVLIDLLSKITGDYQDTTDGTKLAALAAEFAVVLGHRFRIDVTDAQDYLDEHPQAGRR